MFHFLWYQEIAKIAKIYYCEKYYVYNQAGSATFLPLMFYNVWKNTNLNINV